MERIRGSWNLFHRAQQQLNTDEMPASQFRDASQAVVQAGATTQDIAAAYTYPEEGGPVTKHEED